MYLTTEWIAAAVFTLAVIVVLAYVGIQIVRFLCSNWDDE